MAPVSAVELGVALLRRERPLDAISKALCWQIVPIQERDCKFFWPLGPRPEDHPGLSSFGF
jgi:nuclear transport factor 2 (NTF2) superfamily protein